MSLLTNDQGGSEVAIKENFKVGNKVVLNSGGPVMTVKSVESTPLSVRYWCQWFAGKKLEQGQFPQDSLEPVPEAGK